MSEFEVSPEQPDRQVNWANIAIWVFIAAVLTILGLGLIRAQADRPTDVAPEVTFHFFDGYEYQELDQVDLKALRGKVVVLNFWASWCVECRLEADLLEQTWRDYSDQDVVFIGVAYVDVEPKSLEYLAEFNITYPNGPDLRSSISSKYEITGVPETFYIDKNGNVADIKVGPVGKADLVGTIERLLKEPGQS